MARKIIMAITSGAAALLMAGCSLSSGGSTASNEGSSSGAAQNTAAASGGGSSAPASAPAKPIVFGDTVKISDDSGNVFRVTVEAPKVHKPGQYASVGNKTVYAVRVTLVGLAGKPAFNPLYFKAQNAEGDSFDVGLGDLDTELDAGDLPVGSKERGLVAFEVPPGQKITSVSITDPILDSQATWHAA